jgi:hypothetical protein
MFLACQESCMFSDKIRRLLTLEKKIVFIVYIIERKSPKKKLMLNQS